MYCPSCHYGSPIWKPFTRDGISRCSHCNKEFPADKFLTSAPFKKKEAKKTDERPTD